MLVDQFCLIYSLNIIHESHIWVNLFDFIQISPNLKQLIFVNITRVKRGAILDFCENLTNFNIGVLVE